jgi:hypothetical protein
MIEWSATHMTSSAPDPSTVRKKLQRLYAELELKRARK